MDLGSGATGYGCSTSVPHFRAKESDLAPIHLPADLTQNGWHVIHKRGHRTNLGKPELVVRGLSRADRPRPSRALWDLRLRCSGYDEQAKQAGDSYGDAAGEHRAGRSLSVRPRGLSAKPVHIHLNKQEAVCARYTPARTVAECARGGERRTAPLGAL